MVAYLILIKYKEKLMRIKYFSLRKIFKKYILSALIHDYVLCKSVDMIHSSTTHNRESKPKDRIFFF